jgi:hypothetical protein
MAELEDEDKEESGSLEGSYVDESDTPKIEEQQQHDEEELLSESNKQESDEDYHSAKEEI